ncbi:hypothetical protein [Shewanella litoralis]|uniref:hypothetical protein n=1 Tax=Shewanella litoralis TaxID=2282700 RepID=UPI0013588725|nr:hypothetical protein [Shewanella litoralis]
MWQNHLKFKHFSDTLQVHPCKLGHDAHVMDDHSRACTQGSISSLLALYRHRSVAKYWLMDVAESPQVQTLL